MEHTHIFENITTFNHDIEPDCIDVFDILYTIQYPKHEAYTPKSPKQITFRMLVMRNDEFIIDKCKIKIETH